MDRYSGDVLADERARRGRPLPEVVAEPGLVVEEPDGFCGAVVACDAATVTLEDRHGRQRVFPRTTGGFRLDGRPVTLLRPRPQAPAAPRRTASGSFALPPARARVARAGRILVEGIHDAALVERVWGDDLRIEGVVVEPLHGADDLAAAVRAFAPGPQRRLGVLLDHLVPGSKEARLADEAAGTWVLITGHPYIDIWQAVRPASVGIGGWPDVPRGEDWKSGVCARLGIPDGPPGMWRRVLAGVSSYADLETPLLTAVERLIDHVTSCGEPG